MKPACTYKGISGAICAALFLVTLAVYLPSVQHEFLQYDDQQYVTENQHVRAGLTAQGMKWAFGFHASNWHPLTWVSHMLDCESYGLKAGGHHLSNILLHAASTVILFLALRRLTGTVWRSAVVAALFGWHPLHVESVAWIAERKDVLSGLFWMLTLWAYANYAQSIRSQNVQPITSRALGTEDERDEYRRTPIWYVLTLVFFCLALTSKPMVVTLPFVLLLLDYWPLRRIWGLSANINANQGVQSNHRNWQWVVMEKIPFLILSAVACFLTVLAQNQAHSIVSDAGLPFSTRVEHALLAWQHYLCAMFVPRQMAVFYPYELPVPIGKAVLAFVVLMFFTILAISIRERRPYFLAGWLWFLGTLVPVIGLVQVGEQAWADRYTYLPLIGLFVALIWGANEILQSAGMIASRKAFLGGAFAAGIGVVCLTATSVQLRYWKNTRTLFEHAAAVVPHHYMATTLLGSLDAKEGRLEDAISKYEEALREKPTYAEAHFFMGQALDQQGRIEEAIAQYRQALGFKPMQEQSHIFLGAALAKQKKYEEAATHDLAALRLNPESAVAQNNFARLLHTQGRLGEAIDHYRAALQLDPNLAQAHNNLGTLLIQTGKATEGISELREALRLSPENAATEYNLALALNQRREWKEAAEHFAKTVTPASTDPAARFEYGVALGHTGRIREAMSQYAAALLQQPDFPDALANLAWLLSTSPGPEFRNGVEAVRMAERACELTGRNDPAKLKTLAASYAEAGRFPDAISTVENARSVAATSGRQDLAAECQRMSESFQARRAWEEHH